MVGRLKELEGRKDHFCKQIWLVLFVLIICSNNVDLQEESLIR